jgi:CDP-paratose 2-epimerase
MSPRVLITGGAGFVGANLSVGLRSRLPHWEIVAFDNLHRRGSELNLPRLRDAGVQFVHGDVRERGDLDDVGEVEALIECSAEPSVLAGLDGGLDYLVKTNLVGAYNCLEIVRRNDAHLVFLSTSRVYPTGPLLGLALEEKETRFELAAPHVIPGVSAAGISESFPTEGARTLYGATKLAAELLIAEYVAAFGVRAVVDRCGVIAGPWQMGKVDQGVFTYWLLAHYFGRPLSYIGYGGTGKQVRDLLHVDDLVDLVADQVARPDHWSGFTGNVGGGGTSCLSLVETTKLCRELTGATVAIGAVKPNRPGDIPFYVSDCNRLFEWTAWRPLRGPREVLADTLAWVREHEKSVAAALGFG